MRVLTLLLALGLLCYCANRVVAPGAKPVSQPFIEKPNAATSGTWVCVHVVDGDTIDVELGDVRVRVRLLGIDTPERGQPGYKEAADSLRRLAQDRAVRLERPIGANGKPERDTDKYGRLLRQVFVDEVDLSQAQLAGGFAKPYDGGKR